mmetsp:Transcript_17908/g.57230  ORF Transcript_17908/g.57230 Transcript_17908/m.57230 type:complete len:374 (+) Transcript_17908:394-1515(+)
MASVFLDPVGTSSGVYQVRLRWNVRNRMHLSLPNLVHHGHDSDIRETRPGWQIRKTRAKRRHIRPYVTIMDVVGGVKLDVQALHCARVHSNGRLLEHAPTRPSSGATQLFSTIHFGGSIRKLDTVLEEGAVDMHGSTNLPFVLRACARDPLNVRLYDIRHEQSKTQISGDVAIPFTFRAQQFLGAAKRRRPWGLCASALDQNVERAHLRFGICGLLRRVAAVGARAARRCRVCPARGVGPVLHSASNRVHLVVQASVGVQAFFKGTGIRAHARSDHKLRSVVWANIPLVLRLRVVAIVRPRAPLERDRLHTAVVCQRHLEKVLAPDFIDGSSGNRSHAAARIVDRKVAIWVDMVLLTDVLKVTKCVRGRHDHD